MAKLTGWQMRSIIGTLHHKYLIHVKLHSGFPERKKERITFQVLQQYGGQRQTANRSLIHLRSLG